MPNNYTLLFVLCLILVILVLIGRDFEETHPQYTAWVSERKAEDANSSHTLLVQLRTGTFVAMDYLSEAVWPGDRQRVIAFKRSKLTREERLQAKH